MKQRYKKNMNLILNELLIQKRDTYLSQISVLNVVFI
jgi:hypothetical protein